MQKKILIALIIIALLVNIKTTNTEAAFVPPVAPLLVGPQIVVVGAILIAGGAIYYNKDALIAGAQSFYDTLSEIDRAYIMSQVDSYIETGQIFVTKSIFDALNLFVATQDFTQPISYYGHGEINLIRATGFNQMQDHRLDPNTVLPSWLYKMATVHFRIHTENTHPVTWQNITLRLGVEGYEHTTLRFQLEYHPNRYKGRLDLMSSSGLVIESVEIGRQTNLQLNIITDNDKILIYQGAKKIFEFYPSDIDSRWAFADGKNIIGIQIELLNRTINYSNGVAKKWYEYYYANPATYVPRAGDMVLPRGLEWNPEWGETAESEVEIKVPWIGPAPNIRVRTEAGDLVGVSESDLSIAGSIPASIEYPLNPGIDINKGRTFGQFVTTKFPFSLPWDFARLLSLLAADPITPQLSINEDYMGMPFEMEIDFSFLDPYMPFFRAIILIGWCIALVLITRQLLGGAA